MAKYWLVHLDGEPYTGREALGFLACVLGGTVAVLALAFGVAWLSA